MQYYEQNLQTMNQASVLREFLKKLTKFVLSFSLFSFFLLHPSWLPFIIRSFISQCSTFHSQLLSVVTDKNYIFLLCNGILVIIAKYSNRTVNTHPSILPETETETSLDNDTILEQYTLEPSIEKSVLVEDVATMKDEEEETSKANETMPEGETERGNGKFLITDVRQGCEEEEEEDRIFDDYDENNKEAVIENSGSGSYTEEEVQVDVEEVEEEEEEEIAKMSTEELNRKFDDFIRKMKEELRFEAQQQLIMV